MKKKILIIFLILLTIPILIKVLFGNINIGLKIPYKNPIYRLQINDNFYGLVMGIYKRINIIPNTLTFVNSALVSTYPAEIKMKFGEKIYMNIIGYECFSNINGKEFKTGCKNYDYDIMKEIEKMKFDRMIIRGGSEMGLSNHLIYDGEYINDITNLITKKGKYSIEVRVEHKSIFSDLSFIIEVED